MDQWQYTCIIFENTFIYAVISLCILQKLLLGFLLLFFVLLLFLLIFFFCRLLPFLWGTLTETQMNLFHRQNSKLIPNEKFDLGLSSFWLVVTHLCPLNISISSKYSLPDLPTPSPPATRSLPLVTVITWLLLPLLREGILSHSPLRESKNSTEVMFLLPRPLPPDTTMPGRPLIFAWKLIFRKKPKIAWKFW